MANPGALPGIAQEVSPRIDLLSPLAVHSVRQGVDFAPGPFFQKASANLFPPAFSFTGLSKENFPNIHEAPASALLSRRSRYYTQNLLPIPLRNDQWVANLTDQLQSPSNIVLFAMGAHVFRSTQWGFKTEQILETSQALLWGAKSKMGLAFFPSLFAVGCAGSGDGSEFQQFRDAGFQDMNSDAGLPVVDKDHDGAGANIDCDDNNPRVFPLTGKGRVIEIKESTTICQGIYSGFSLYVPSGTKNIILSGEGVTLEGVVENQDRPVAAQAIRVINSDNIDVRGFGIQYYDEPLEAIGMLRVENSRKVTLQNLEITGDLGNLPVALSNSEGVIVKNIKTHTHSDRALRAENCKGTRIENSIFRSEKPHDSIPAYALVYVEGGTNNTLLGSQIYTGQSCGLYVKDSNSFQADDNTIQGNLRTGIFLENANQGIYRNNRVNNNGEHFTLPQAIGFGLYLMRGSKNNLFSRNDFTANLPSAYGARFDAFLNQNTFTDNTPQP